MNLSLILARIVFQGEAKNLIPAQWDCGVLSYGLQHSDATSADETNPKLLFRPVLCMCACGCLVVWFLGISSWLWCRGGLGWAGLGWFMLLLKSFLFIGQIFGLSMIVLVTWFYTLVLAAQSVLKSIIVIIDILYKALSLQWFCFQCSNTVVWRGGVALGVSLMPRLPTHSTKKIKVICQRSW